MVNETKEFAEQFDVDDVRELEKYMGCKIELNCVKQSLKFT